MTTPTDEGFADDFARARDWRLMAIFARGRWARICGGLLLYILKQSPAWVIPLFIADAVTILVSPGANGVYRLTMESGAMVGLLALNVVVSTHYAKWIASFREEIQLRLRTEMWRRLSKVSLEYFWSQSIGKLHQRLLMEVDQACWLLNVCFDGIFSSLLNISVVVAITAVRQPSFLPALMVFGGVAFLMMRSFTARIQVHTKAVRAERESLSEELSNNIGVMGIARAHATEHTLMTRLSGHFQSLGAAGTRADLASARFMALSSMVHQSCYVLSFLGLVYLSTRNIVAVSAADAILVASYFLQFTHSVMTLAGLMPGYSRGMEGLRSVQEIFQHPELDDSQGLPPVDQVRGGIQFDNVTFSYKGEEAPTIANASFTIAPGEVVAFVGASGSGKSTLVKLALGFLPPASGRILVDGFDLREIDRRSFRKAVAIVPQEIAFTSGTIRENFLIGKDGATDAEIRAALKTACAESFVTALPEGIDTPCGKNGTRFSGGQRQRLAIATAIIRRPAILILDEATSALDMKTEGEVQAALANVIRERSCTVIIIAHRPSTLRLADRIFTVSDGALIATTSTHVDGPSRHAQRP